MQSGGVSRGRVCDQGTTQTSFITVSTVKYWFTTIVKHITIVLGFEDSYLELSRFGLCFELLDDFFYIVLRLIAAFLVFLFGNSKAYFLSVISSWLFG